MHGTLLCEGRVRPLSLEPRPGRGRQFKMNGFRYSHCARNRVDRTQALFEIGHSAAVGRVREAPVSAECPQKLAQALLTHFAHRLGQAPN